MKEKHVIDALLNFDKRSKEDVAEFETTGAKSLWLYNMETSGFYVGGKIKHAVGIVRDICCSSKTTRDEKVFQLEAVECDFSILAEYLGFDLRHSGNA